jgi:SAM-dependent methyltransferase
MERRGGDDLAGAGGGRAERFVPETMSGRLIEAEHVGRYRWAAAWASGCRVLDAGCGTAYGAAMMARAGASDVVGVDMAAEALERAPDEIPAGVQLEVADLRDLPFADDRFELVVCFEVIEYIENPARALDELARVLAPGGLLIISWPNRAAYPPVNPHHVQEFLPSELERELRARWRHVRLARQHNYVADAVLDDDGFRAADDRPLRDVAVHNLAGAEPGFETYTLAIAGDREPPDLPGVISLDAGPDLREWLEALDRHRQEIYEYGDRSRSAERPLDQRTREMETQYRELETQYRALERCLVEATSQNAALHERVERAERVLRDLEASLAEASCHNAALRERVERADRVLRDVKASASWRITAPLRAAKRLMRGT